MKFSDNLVGVRRYLPEGSAERKALRLEEGNAQHTGQGTSWENWTLGQFIAAINQEGDDQWLYLEELCNRLEELPMTRYRRGKLHDAIARLAWRMQATEVRIEQLAQQVLAAEKKP